MKTFLKTLTPALMVATLAFTAMATMAVTSGQAQANPICSHPFLGARVDECQQIPAADSNAAPQRNLTFDPNNDSIQSGINMELSRDLTILSEAAEVFGQELEEIRSDIDDNSTGIAISMALGSAALSQTQKFSVTGSLGYFSDQTAVGINGSFRMQENFYLSLGGGIGVNRGVLGGRALLVGEW